MTPEKRLKNFKNKIESVQSVIMITIKQKYLKKEQIIKNNVKTPLNVLKLNAIVKKKNQRKRILKHYYHKKNHQHN